MPTSVINALIPLTESEVETVARRAVLALGNMKIDLVLPSLIRALSDRESVRQNAKTSLERLVIQIEDPALKKWVAKCLTDALEQQSSWNAQNSTIQIIGKLGDVAIDPLLMILKDTSDTTRLRVVEALGYFADVRVIKVLIATLRDNNNSHMRLRAIEALYNIAIKNPIYQSQVTEVLISAIHDRDGSVRTAVVEYLGGLENEQIVMPLIAALKDRNSKVREKAAKALEKLGEKGLINPSVLALEIGKQLKDIEGENDPLQATIEKSPRWVQIGADKAAKSLGQQWIIEAFSTAVTSKDISDISARLNATQSLGKIGDLRAINCLITTLEDEEVV